MLLCVVRNCLGSHVYWDDSIDEDIPIVFSWYGDHGPMSFKIIHRNHSKRKKSWLLWILVWYVMHVCCSHGDVNPSTT